MKTTVLRAMLLGACLATLAACASVDPRDEREDIGNTMKADLRACGSDTECIRKRQASHSPAATPAPAR